MIDGSDSYEELYALNYLREFFADTNGQEQTMLKAREDYYRKRLAERPEPPPVEVAKYRKKKPVPTRLLQIIQFPECEYRRERRIFAPPTKRLSRDAQHRSWDGYEWSIV